MGTFSMVRESISDTCFAQADAYRHLHPSLAHSVHEKRHADAFAYTERHLKCIWYDPAFRPRLLQTEQGDEITVEQAGRWNLEAGPDFLDAALRVGPDRRRMTGDVEIHVHPADWHRHAHVQNPAYARVIAHVTYFSGYLPADSLPRGAVQIALKDSLSDDSLFSFENLDVTAYPYASRTPSTPCSMTLRQWSPENLIAFFEAAGEERLRRKAERLALAIEEKGNDQVLYEELMSALGYKNNRMPFRSIAEQFPLTALREDSCRDPMTAYALLMGMAGLLPAQTEARWDSETRAFVRQLWNRWWKHQSKWNARALRQDHWILSGIRPQNHPRRRLMAAALLFTRKVPLTQHLLALPADEPDEWINHVMTMLRPDADLATAPSLRRLRRGEDPAKTGFYWRYRLTLGGKPQPTPVSLTGSRRVSAMISNVIIPFLAALEEHRFSGVELLRRLPPEEDNSIVRQAAHHLLGPDHNPTLYRTGLRQQGLIQIFHDFCLNDRSGCAACPLLQRLDSFHHD